MHERDLVCVLLLARLFAFDFQSTATGHDPRNIRLSINPAFDESPTLSLEIPSVVSPGSKHFGEKAPKFQEDMLNEFGFIRESFVKIAGSVEAIALVNNYSVSVAGRGICSSRRLFDFTLDPFDIVHTSFCEVFSQLV
jgi:hypothetical protein